MDQTSSQRLSEDIPAIIKCVWTEQEKSEMMKLIARSHNISDKSMIRYALIKDDFTDNVTYIEFQIYNGTRGLWMRAMRFNANLSPEAENGTVALRGAAGGVRRTGLSHGSSGASAASAAGAASAALSRGPRR